MEKIIRKENIMNARKIQVEMTLNQHKRYLAFLEADEIVRGIKKALKEFNSARKEGKRLKSAYELIAEL